MKTHERRQYIELKFQFLPKKENYIFSQDSGKFLRMKSLVFSA